MVKRSNGIRLWVSEFQTYIDGEYVWEWAVRKPNPLGGEDETYGKAGSRMMAEYEATKTFEMFGGEL